MNDMIGSLWQKICTLAQKGHMEFIYYLEKMAVNGFPSQSRGHSTVALAGRFFGMEDVS